MKWEDCKDKVTKIVHAKLPQYKTDYIEVVGYIPCIDLYHGHAEDKISAGRYMATVMAIISEPGIDYGKIYMWSFNKLINEEIIKE